MARVLARVAWLYVALILVASAAEPLRYVVRIPEPHKNYAEVELTLPADSGPSPELKMAIWTPYVAREYAGLVEKMAATDSSGPATITKSAKNRWRLQPKAYPAKVTYRVYAHTLHAQDNWIDSEFALLNPAALFATLTGESRSHIVRVEVPPAWKQVLIPLPSNGHGEFTARDYDQLADSPILAGNPNIQEFTSGGKKHVLATFGDIRLFDASRARRDLQKVANEQIRFWGTTPFETYYFFNVLGASNAAIHAMEHAQSTVVVSTPRLADSNYKRWLVIASHEYFHVWNVKSLRPAEIIPGDFEAEPLTPSLGISEGFTNYYGVLMLARAGLANATDTLQSFSQYIQTVQTSPGRLEQSLVQSSIDTFIKFYRPNEDSRNSTISYYDKGALVALLLDTRIRSLTEGRKSLDDAMRTALREHPNGFTLAQFEKTVSGVAGTDLGAFFRDTFHRATELNYTEVLDYYGLTFNDNPFQSTPQLGIEANGATVTAVLRGGPAYEAGINVGDELIAVNDARFVSLSDALARYGPGDRVYLTLARRGRTIRLETVLGRFPSTGWNLLIADRVTPQQTARLKEWLRPSAR